MFAKIGSFMTVAFGSLGLRKAEFAPACITKSLYAGSDVPSTIDIGPWPNQAPLLRALLRGMFMCVPQLQVEHSSP